MQDILELGIEWIVWLQQFRTPALDHFFQVYTNFGGTDYLYTIPFVLWCLDYRLGLRLSSLFTATLFVNTTLKEWFGEPRPFQMDARVVSAGEYGYGLPSGHAQLVVVFWGVIAAWVERPAFWCLAVLLMALMGFSRVYLGVHFPSDVIVGWALGALGLWLFLGEHRRIEDWLGASPLARPIAGSLGLAALLFVVDALFVGEPGHINDGTVGFAAGAGVGGALGLRFLTFTGAGPWPKRALRYLLGMALTLPLLGLLRWLGAPQGLLGQLVVTVDLALFGLWLTLPLPWLFERLRL